MNMGRLGFSNVPLQFSTPLNGVAWAVLAGIPVAIVKKILGSVMVILVASCRQ